MKKEEYPILQWKGKKRPEPIKYFPAQLKERHGEAKDGWMNKIFWGDNLQVMSHLLKEYRGKVDLIYIDPPFDSKKNYKKKIKLKGKKNNNDINTFEEKQYSDIWTNDEYLQFMYERLIMIRELLSMNGVIALHCDWHKSHHLRLILDEVFGGDKFLNEIVWKYESGGIPESFFSQKHDIILIYSKTSNYIFNKKNAMRPRNICQMCNTTLDKWNNLKKHVDKDGRVYRTIKSNGKVYTYYDDEPTLLSDVWTDINHIQQKDPQRVGYPTQKPESLLNRIISVFSNNKSIIFDCFMGSGTTQTVAMKLGRRFIGTDINLGAIQTTTKRLINIANNGSEDDGNYYGFEVYNVNKHNSVKSEADVCVVVENNKLKINDFFSIKLSQKMNIEKGKENWRRLVEFIVIDLNYDGNVIRPSIIDIPSKNELVKGEYDIPCDTGKIKVKITDISLETFEVEIT